VQRRLGRPGLEPGNCARRRRCEPSRATDHTSALDPNSASLAPKHQRMASACTATTEGTSAQAGRSCPPELWTSIVVAPLSSWRDHKPHEGSAKVRTPSRAERKPTSVAVDTPGCHRFEASVGQARYSGPASRTVAPAESMRSRLASRATMTPAPSTANPSTLSPVGDPISTAPGRSSASVEGAQALVARSPRVGKSQRERRAHSAWAISARLCVAEAQHAKVVEPPALDGAVVESCARVVAARGELQGGPAGPEVYRRQGCAQREKRL
jgi:hypothetical protein